jgi:hypothetical protein
MFGTTIAIDKDASTLLVLGLVFALVLRRLLPVCTGSSTNTVANAFELMVMVVRAAWARVLQTLRATFTGVYRQLYQHCSERPRAHGYGCWRCLGTGAADTPSDFYRCVPAALPTLYRTPSSSWLWLFALLGHGCYRHSERLLPMCTGSSTNTVANALELMVMVARAAWARVLQTLRATFTGVYRQLYQHCIERLRAHGYGCSRCLGSGS